MFLNCHSWFSFKYGTMSPEELLKQAQERGVRSFALTDIHNTAGVSDLVRLAHRHAVRPVVGIEFRDGARLLYIGVACNNEGFRRLNELLSPHLLDRVPLPDRAPELPDTFIIYPLSNAPGSLRPNERVGVRPSELTRLPFGPWARRPRELVALASVTFRHKRDFNTHRLLRTVARNTVVSLLPPGELADADERFRSTAEMRSIYADHPQLVRNAEEILEQCSIAFDGTDKTRQVVGASAATDRERLWADTLTGLRHRYPNGGERERRRMERELEVIERMGFISYFLINQDIVRFARSKGYFHVGRGSGANSLVAYCLGITDVDPIELDLYFERFISTARKKPPDFDIDFSWKDRDEVFKYVFDTYGPAHTAQIATYTTFQWRGAVRELGKAVGLPPDEIDALGEGDSGYSGRGGTHGSVRKGGLDDVTRAVVKYAGHLIGMPHQFGIHAGGILVSERPLTYYTALHRPPKGFPVTQFSMLEAEDLGLHKFDLLSQRGLGHIRDAVELVDRNAESLNTGTRTDIHDIQRFKTDPRIKELIRTGNTIGCFYVESPAMRMLLKKLRVDDYLGLVAASSIIRPGVAESGMMREYLLRHNDPKRREEAPRSLYSIMPETYGVMVYQEDVIKVAHLYAGLDPEEADLIRRGMTSRFRERPEFKEVEARFFANCKAKGHPDQEVREVWRQMESFASFSFAKGHSASYAVESYQSLYLKAYHPLEFLVGVANNFGGFYSTEFYLHEAKRAGAMVEAPCVNSSEELCSLVRGGGAPLSALGGNACPVPEVSTAERSAHHPGRIDDRPRVLLGLHNIKGLWAGSAQQVLSERWRNGPFADLQDLLRRVPLHVEQARILVRVGALRFTGRSKPQLLWDLALLHRGTGTADPIPDLFVTKVENPKLPDLQHYPLADAYDELDLLGFPLCDPFTLVDPEPVVRGRVSPAGDPVGHADAPGTVRQDDRQRTMVNAGPAMILAREMASRVGRKVRMLGYMIHVKSTDTHHGQRMSFGSFIDPAGDFWDSTQFPAVAERHPFQGRGVYRLTGTVEEEFGHCALRTERIEKLPWKADPRYGDA